MTDIPIIFSAPMIQALLAGRKTMSRRLAWRDDVPSDDGDPDACPQIATPWQRVKPGDRLWVRENFLAFGRWQVEKKAGKVRYTFERRIHAGDLLYAADEPPIKTGKFAQSEPAWHLRPNIFMERQHSRLTLVVSATKVERLQDISEADAQAEGATARHHVTSRGQHLRGWSMDWPLDPNARFDNAHNTARHAFGCFICRLHDGDKWNLKPTNIWSANPEVVALSFSVHKINIDSMKEAA